MNIQQGTPIVVLFANLTKGFDDILEPQKLQFKGQLKHTKMDKFFDAHASTFFIVVIKNNSKDGWVHVHEGDRKGKIRLRKSAPQPVSPIWTMYLHADELVNIPNHTSHINKTDIFELLEQKYNIIPKLKNFKQVGIVEMIRK
jgi:hypothetical protein